MWQYAVLFAATPVLLDAHNIEYKNVRQIGASATSPLWRLLYLIEEKRLKAVEVRAWKECDLCFAVSEKECAEIASCIGNESKVITAANGVDLDRFVFQPQMSKNKKILFLGGMDYAPNLDAALWFLRDIFPLILHLEPEARLLMVGRELWRLNGDESGCQNWSAVEFYENVPDVLPWFYEANILVVPLRQGAGTRIKMLEAFAAGLPVVATAKGCEGIAAQNGEQLLIADTPHDFAAAVLQIMSDATLGKNLAESARCLVEERYTWNSAVKNMEQSYQRLQLQS
jgi:glycosyltransferase involved in cell wall biosynthesis